MKDRELSESERELWHAWKQAAEAVIVRVERDIVDAAGLSGADFGVLSRLADGGNELRQQDLADSLGWDKSRLSHQLSRMEERALLVRETAGPKLVVIRITPNGTRALTKARPAHAAGVRAHLLEKISRRQRAAMLEQLKRLREP